jgi:GNAT superfamily N-acetyltransferase
VLAGHIRDWPAGPDREPAESGHGLYLAAQLAGHSDWHDDASGRTIHGTPPPDRRRPPPGDRARAFPGFFRILLDWAMAGGTVTTTPARDAAALWIPAGTSPPSPPADYPARVAAVAGTRAARFAAFDAALEEHHPAGAAHEWLAILAVRPDRQGQGAGSALPRSRHRHLDQSGLGACLEAATARARDLYLGHGYLLRPGAPLHLPEDGPAMWPMWRDPQQPAGQS